MKSFLAKLLIKYRVDIINKNTLEKATSFYMKKIYFFVVGFILFFISFLLSLVILFYTPMGNKVYDYSKKNEINDLFLTVDSLENIVNLHLDFSNNLRLILNEQKEPLEAGDDGVVFSIDDIKSMNKNRDSLLVDYIKGLDEVSITKYNKNILNKLKISEPTKGIVTSNFDTSTNHFGVDVAAEENSEVFSVLDGVVLFSGYSKKLGNFLILQHDHRFSSIYLHNAQLFKKRGDLVYSGEKIALVGSTGELSSAPHLHFELWSGGVPIDPKKYLQFN
tara:strand:- start:1056 stop:1886 length:831 start_codon:yes stop_codon:yes gene_type:complete